MFVVDVDDGTLPSDGKCGSIAGDRLLTTSFWFRKWTSVRSTESIKLTGKLCISGSVNRNAPARPSSMRTSIHPICMVSPMFRRVPDAM